MHTIWGKLGLVQKAGTPVNILNQGRGDKPGIRNPFFDSRLSAHGASSGPSSY